MELVVARYLVDELACALVLEDDEVAQQIQKASLVENAFEDSCNGQRCCCVFASGNRAPGFEPFTARAERADARLYAVRDN